MFLVEHLIFFILIYYHFLLVENKVKKKDKKKIKKERKKGIQKGKKRSIWSQNKIKKMKREVEKRKK